MKARGTLEIPTARGGGEVAFRRKAGGNPKSAAKAVTIDRLESTTTGGVRGGRCTRHHKWCAHVQVAKLRRAALCLDLAHLGLNHDYDQNSH